MSIDASFVSKTFKLLGVVTFSYALLATQIAYAGFEWIPGPSQNAPRANIKTMPAEDEMLSPLPPVERVDSAPAKPVMRPVTQAPGETQVIRRKTITPSALPPKPVKPMAASPKVETRVVMPEDAPQSAKSANENASLIINPFPQNVKPAPATSQSLELPPVAADQNSMHHESTEKVVGFGSDIPLALAVQNIAPAGFTFSFGENVNPGAKVSWEGGKPWTIVLEEMIAPIGLKASVRGQTIFIHSSQDSAGDVFTELQTSTGAEQPAQLVRRNTILDPGASSQEQAPTALSLLETSAKNSMNDGATLLTETAIWEAEKGDSLKQTLNSWGRKGDFDVEWNAMHDYALQSDILVAGKIDSAIQTIARTGTDVQNGPLLTLISAPSPKLVVEDREI